MFDVPGEPLLDGEEYATATQDLLFNNAPMVELTDVKTTLEIQQIRERNFDSVTGLAAELAKRSDRSKQFAPAMLPNEYVIGATMYSQGRSGPTSTTLYSHITRSAESVRSPPPSRIRLWSLCGQVLARPQGSSTDRIDQQDDPVRRIGHIPPGPPTRLFCFQSRDLLFPGPIHLGPQDAPGRRRVGPVGRSHGALARGCRDYI